MSSDPNNGVAVSDSIGAPSNAAQTMPRQQSERSAAFQRSACTTIRLAFGTTVLERALHSDGHLDGIGIYTLEMLRHLPRIGITPQKVAFEGFRGTQIGSDVFPLPGRFSRNLLKSAVLGIPFSGNRDISGHFDLFHATDHHIPKYTRVPVLANLMDPVPLMNPDWSDSHLRRVKNWFFRRSAQWADRYVTISQFVVSDLVTYFGIPRHKIDVVELGVDDIYFEPIPEDERIANLATFGIKGPFFLFIGTLQPRKNVSHVIDAFNRLPLKMRRACPLVVAGRAGWSSERERDQLAKLSAEGTGQWLDYVTPFQKRCLLQSARAFVFPSLYEGFGLPVLEAFASRLPVIASDFSSIPEVAGNAAALLPPRDIEAWTSAMTRIVEDDQWHDSLVGAGLLRAQGFTWSETARKTAAIYSDMAAQA